MISYKTSLPFATFSSFSSDCRLSLSLGVIWRYHVKPYTIVNTACTLSHFDQTSVSDARGENQEFDVNKLVYFC